MPYAENNGVRIHYKVVGAGKPLVLHHGFTESIEDWSECGYVDALQSQHRLILIDARGHGRSDKPHDPLAYLLEKRVRDVVGVLDAIGIEKAHFWGYSMGGWVGFGMAQFAPDRIDRLVIGGQHPFARSMEHLRQMVRAGIDGGADAFVTAFHKTFGPAEGAFAERLRAADLQAYLALLQDRPALDELLPRMSMPCCLYAGDADDVCEQARSASERIPGASSFPSRGSITARPSLGLSLCCPGSCRSCWGRGTSEDATSCVETAWPETGASEAPPMCFRLRQARRS